MITGRLSPRSRRFLGVLGLVLLAFLLNWVVASCVLFRCYDGLSEDVALARWPISDGRIECEIRPPAKDKPKAPYRAAIVREGEDFSVKLDAPGEELSPLRLGRKVNVLSLSAGGGVSFRANDPDFSELRVAFAELGAALPRISWKDRLLASLYLRPLLSGVRWEGGGVSWRISFNGGHLWTGGELGIRTAEARVGGWQGKLSWQQEVGDSAPPQTVDAAKEVPGVELVASLAEVVRILAWHIGPSRVEPDGLSRSGAGWLRVENGHRQMLLQGEPYEIGLQHGRLGAAGIRRMAHRVVYGVGLLYSLKQGEWFPTAARALVERQRPFILPEYFEEMRGVADGSGVSFDLIRLSNIFPEFFHCSGVAIMGDASVGGELLHARVLDYITEIGLQDEAAVIAVARPGALRFVTVGFLGFIGSVTGMNEKQVAIGEMGGAGQGDWDGVPMSFLIRRALETANTLGDVERYMRESPRACEFYYLITDGKGPEALGVAATPEKFETFGPGVWTKQLQKPVEDTLLLSGPGRYENLVKRVKASYGSIDCGRLMEIIRRPVAMESNLHNVIFQPQSLRLSVSDAVRHGVACDQPYRTYDWAGLFSQAP